MARFVTITVAPDGSIVAKSSGQPGNGCLGDLNTIQALLPFAEVADSRLTPEYLEIAHAEVVRTDHEWEKQGGS